MLRVHLKKRPYQTLLFANKAGRPRSQTNLLRRSLHPLLAKIGVPKAGFHAMRRFRTTWLRKQRAPEDLIKFWLGHAKGTITDAYSKLEHDLGSGVKLAQALKLKPAKLLEPIS